MTPPEAFPGTACAGDLASPAPAIPKYLSATYSWAYLSPRWLRLLDSQLVVSAILWGNYRRLCEAAIREIERSERVLQPACVYGGFSAALARRVGPAGRLDVIDVAPLQVENCRRKLDAYPQARVRHADAAAPGGEPYDAVCCFFLLHELPDDYKGRVVDALLAAVRPGGPVVFVDYHPPHRAHPLKLPLGLVFDTLEPFARTLWRRPIRDFARHGRDFSWRTETYFGALYQKTVARRSE